MIVILEGSDKAGKTTIARRLEADGFRYVHFGRPETNDFGQEFIERLSEELLTEILEDKPTRDLVFDRSHLSELVYGPLDRGEARMTWVQMDRIERMFNLAGALLIWVDTPPEVCWSRAIGTEDVDEKLRFELIHELYESAFERSVIPKLRLTDVESIRRIIKWFKEDV